MGFTSENKPEKQITMGILAHVDAGKTTLSEGILYTCKAIRMLGRVDHQDAFLDTNTLERNRGITIFSKQAECTLGEFGMTFLDTPGHVDFSAEMERTLQVLDYAILVISGADGVQGHTETLWRLLSRYQIPVFLFINKMDQPGTDREALLAEVKEKLDANCVEFSADQTDEEWKEQVAVCDYTLDTLIPQVGIITDIRQETPDVKTFRVNAPEGGKLFEHMPGQCAMVCAPGVSEGMFSITSSPTNKEYQEFSIKKCGMLTDYLHSLQVGDEITVRGPYGNHFPVETELKGKNLLFIAGGIGLAPLRSVINYVLDNRENYGTVDILYGSRSADDLVQLKEIQEVWMKAEGVNVYLTIDREQEGWDGHVGFVPTYLKEIGFDTDKVALVCGPPIMIKFVLAGLQEMGFTKEQVYTTLELRMKCGVGKCGRCNIGSKYVCKDGPVFRFDEIDELPNEY